MGRKYALPIGVGFIGMFLCHFGLFLGMAAGMDFPPYVIAYPIVYAILAIVLALLKPGLWLTDALFLCLVPFVYWYSLLISDGKFSVTNFSLRESSGMWLTMLISVGVSLLCAFAVSKDKTQKEPAA